LTTLIGKLDIVSKLIEFVPFVIAIIPLVGIIFAAVDSLAVEPINICPLFK
jgi:hypothetical protein